ncbi:nonribosomal peptide synthase [Aspergillus udagawae]|uniref:Nonribosomal peptide synthase n=1 Tax=Aspergillus udagawae TaxID=91492 RepID=A0A8E0R269_9EURO|nr:nonribosomal peptide synthase [Aspergillus udagawae]GIC93053.1 nonribosomal peptide synthase [Aspergillus udagawae]
MSTERVIAPLCAEVLRRPIQKLRMNKSFMAHGGDSLLAMKLMGRCREEGYSLSIHDIMQATTLQELCASAHLTKNESAGGGTDTQGCIVKRNMQAQPNKNADTASTHSIKRDCFYIPQMEPGDLGHLQEHILPGANISLDEVEDICRCAPIQEGILVSQLKTPTQYYSQHLFQIKSTSDPSGEINVDRLLQAWQHVVDRHSMLRTVFVACPQDTDGGPTAPFLQVVLKSVNAQVDHKRCEDTDVGCQLASRAAVDRCFFRSRVEHSLTCYTTSSRRIFAQFTINHALADASTFLLLLKELAQSYYGNLPAMKGTPYSVYVSYLQRTQEDQALEYWKRRLSGQEPCHLPTFPLDSSYPTTKGGVATVEMTGDAVTDIQEFSQTHCVTMANIIQTAWALVLSLFTGSPSVCFGYVSSGRDVPITGAHQIVGPMINMMVTRLHIDPGCSVKQVIQSVQREFLQGFNHQRIPLARIWHALQLKGQGLFNTALSYRSDRGQEVDDDTGLDFEHVYGEDRPEYAASVNVVASPGKILLSLQYYPDSMTSDVVSLLLSCLQRTLSSLVVHPDLAIGQVRVVSPGELKQICDWNDKVDSRAHHRRFGSDGPALAPTFPPRLERSYHLRPSNRMGCRLQVPSQHSPAPLGPLLRTAWAFVVSTYTDGNVLFGEVVPRGPPQESITIPRLLYIDKSQLVHECVAAAHLPAADMVSFEHACLPHIRRLAQKIKHLPHQFSIAAGRERDDTSQAINNSALAIRCIASVSNDSSEIHIEAQFNEEAVSRIAARRLLDRLRHIFTQLHRIHVLGTDSSGTRVEDIEIICPEEVTQLAVWNQSKIAEASADLIHDLVYRHALTRADAAAVCSWDGDLSHGALDRLAETLAHHLSSLGIGPEVMVGLCFDKTKWAIVSMLAILKTGGTVVPILSERTQRGQAIIENAGIRIVVTTARPSAQFCGDVSHVVPVDEEFIAQLPRHSNRVISTVTPSNAAFVYHTSGSTGLPKGVVIEHKTISHSLLTQGRKFGITSDTRAYQFSPLTFDMALHDIMATLLQGGCVCLPREEEKLVHLRAAINRMRVNKVCLAPRVLQLLRPEEVPLVKTVIVGGEAVQEDQIEPWLHSARVFNAYGPTECAIMATYNLITNKSQASNIGRAMSGSVWVVDQSDCNRLQPIGAPGELLVGGPLVARGYLHAPEKTSAAFISNPAWLTQYRACLANGSPTEQRLYRTGDLVRQLDDGSLGYIGRVDNQVQIRGQRTELGEIEKYIWRHLAVADAVVLYPGRGPCKERMVGILVFQDFRVPATSSTSIRPTGLEQQSLVMEKAYSVRQYLAGCIPEYMIPNAWISLEYLPQSSSYKVDRPRLTAWLEAMDQDNFDRLTQGSVHNTPEMPTSNLERQVHTVCAQVLKLPSHKVTMRRSFLSLGGDSITAMQLVSRLQTRCGLTVGVREVLQSKSLTELAQKSSVLSPEIEGPATTAASFDLSPIQQLYFGLFAPKGSDVRDENRFNQSVCLTAQYDIDVDGLRQAAEALVRKHPMLRARFHLAPDGWKQRVDSSVASAFQFFTHDVQTPAAAEAVILSAETQLNIEEGPVFSVNWIRVASSNNHQLFLTAHHLVIDIVSWTIIIHDLEDLLQNPTTALQQRNATSYQSWIRLLHEHSKDYKPLGNNIGIQVPKVDWEFWGLTPETNVYGGCWSEQIALDEENTSLLFSEDQHLRTEPVEVLLAALFHSFRHVFPDRPLPAVFNEGHGREPWDSSIDVSNTVGWFTMLTPIRPGFVHDDPIEILRRTKDTRRTNSSEALVSSWLQFLRPIADRNAATTPYRNVEVTFNYAGRDLDPRQTNSLFTTEHNLRLSGIGSAVKRLSVVGIEVSVRHGRVQAGFHYNRQMRRGDAVKRWAQAYLFSLKQMLQRLSTSPPIYTLSDFSIAAGMTDDDLSLLQTRLLPRAGIDSLSQVEDIYPSSPVQEGILISKSKDPSLYNVLQIYKIIPPPDAGPVDANRLGKAWEAVICRHSILRTIFFSSSSSRSAFLQVVRKEWKPKVLRCRCSRSTDVVATFASLGRPQYAEGQPNHRLSVCETTSEGTYIQLDANHALMDASSIDLLIRDLCKAYQGALPMGSAPSYGTYTSFLQKVPADTSLAYWTNRLSGASPCDFPPTPPSSSSGPGPEVGKGPWSHVQADFDAVRELHKFRDTYGVTVASLLQLAWGLLLSRHAGLNDVVFGFLTNGRDAPIPGVDAMIGPMINMMVSRIKFDSNSDLTSAGAAKQVQEDFLEALQYRRTSLGEIHHALGLSDIGLFKTALSCRGKSTDNDSPADAAQLAAQQIAVEDPTEYDITVHILEGRQTLTVFLQYALPVVSDGLAHRLLDGLQSVLLSIVRNADSPLKELDALSPSEVYKLRKWNSEIPKTVETLVPDRISKQCFSNPSAPAVRSWDGCLSYDGLHQWAFRLAHYLRSKLGVHEEVMVGLCFDKSMWTIVAMLAVLQAGGVVVPLGTRTPSQRLRFMLDQTGATVILTTRRYSKQFEQMGVAHVLSIDAAGLSALPAISQPSDLRPLALTATNAVVVIYTSGSTGQPKGVVLTHGSLSTAIVHHGRLWNMGPNTRTLQFSAYVFDISLLEILATLSSGGCVCVVSEEDRMDGERLAVMMESMSVNLAVLTPTVAALLKPQSLPTLDSLILAGEKPSPAILQTWSPYVNLFNGYGPSECTILCSTTRGCLTVKDDAANIGWAIAGPLWVANPTNINTLVPLGTVGELLVEGPLLAREYLNSPEMSSKAFIVDPTFITRHRLGPQSGARRLYRTGDLVRQDPSDGSLTYIGRADDQVKIRGQRVELGEIEYWVKTRLTEVREVAANIVDPGQVCPGSDKRSSPLLAVAMAIPKQLIASPRVSQDLETSAVSLLPLSDKLREYFIQLRTSLLDVLPHHMVPQLYLPFAQLPLTDSGKLNRRATWEAVQRSSSLLSQYLLLRNGTKLPPSTPAQLRLRALWAEVLSIPPEQLDVTDDFFRVGGNSISAMRLVTQARAEGGHFSSITVGDIFRFPILSDMAASVDNKHTIKDSLPSTIYTPFSAMNLKESESADSLRQRLSILVSVPGSMVIDAAPVTYAQALVVIGVLRKTRDYLAYISLDADGMPDITRWRRSCLELIQRHEILRTAYIVSQGQLAQVVLKEYQPRVSVFKTSSGQTVEAFARDLIAQDMGHPPRLGRPFTEFAVLIDEKRLQHRVVFRTSHAEYDQISLSYFMDDLRAIYNHEPVPESLPFPRYMYGLQQQSRKESAEYWRSLLQGAQMPTIADESPSKEKRQNPARLTHCPQRRVRAKQSPPGGITTSVIVHAAWALTLAKHFNTHDVLYGGVVSGRNISYPGAVRAAGCCINIVPVRVILDPSCTILNLFYSLREQLLTRIPHETLASRDILATATCPGLPSSTYFTSRLNHLETGFKWTMNMGGLKYCGSIFLPDGAEDHTNISISSIQQADGGVEIGFGYATGVVSRPLAETLLDSLCEILEYLLNGSHDKTLDSVLPALADNDDRVNSRAGENPEYKLATAPEGAPASADKDFDFFAVGCTALSLKQQGYDVTVDDLLDCRSDFPVELPLATKN